MTADLWEKTRERGIRPAWIGPLSSDPELRAESLAGFALLGLELVDLDDADAIAELRARGKDPIQPQQLLIADALNAGLKRNVVEIPRRASKTTSILAVLLGRCIKRPGYKVTFSAQTGVAGRDALEEWIKNRLDPEGTVRAEDTRRAIFGIAETPKRVQRQVALFGDELTPDELRPDENPMRSYRTGNSSPGIRFRNGSTFDVLKPEGAAYRGRAADVCWVDEAQEVPPEEGDDVLAGILPLQDTRPGGQIIWSGTAGQLKDGPFWDFLDRLRQGDPAMGGIDFAADPDTPWELIEDVDRAMELLETMHPGVATLTTIDVMRENWRDIPRPKWAREYLSLWPETYGVRAIAPEAWAGTLIRQWPDKPRRFALAFDVARGGSSAALAAAWRDENGVAYIDVIDHRNGEAWLPTRILDLKESYGRQLKVAYDSIGDNATSALAIKNLRIPGRARLDNTLVAHRADDMYTGSERLMRDLLRGQLRHGAHVGLDAAVASAIKREQRAEFGKWTWSAGDSGADITPLRAATSALRYWDVNLDTRGRRSAIVVGVGR